jgi:hypothetical protein
VRDKAHQPSTTKRLNEIAKTYFKVRLRAIGRDMCTIQSAYRQGKLPRQDVLSILRSLAQAQGEVQTALEKIASVED